MTPLDGIRVIDVTEGAQGPYAATLLGGLGAEVIKIERPGGELMRRSGPFVGGLALPCLSICHSRAATVVLDLKSPADREQLRGLIAHADVFIQNWKIGTDARLGLAFEDCRALNPRLVYVCAAPASVRWGHSPRKARWTCCRRHPAACPGCPAKPMGRASARERRSWISFPPSRPARER